MEELAGRIGEPLHRMTFTETIKITRFRSKDLIDTLVVYDPDLHVEEVSLLVGF